MKRSWRSCRNVRQRTTALWSTLLQRSEPWRRVLVHCLHQFHIKTTTATKMLYWKWNTEVERTREQKRDIQPNLARLSGGDGTTDIQSRMFARWEEKSGRCICDDSELKGVWSKSFCVLKVLFWPFGSRSCLSNVSFASKPPPVHVQSDTALQLH